MNKRTFFSAIIGGLAMLHPSVRSHADMPASSTGVTGGGNSGGHSSGTVISSPARNGQQSTSPNTDPNGGTATQSSAAGSVSNNGTIMDNAKPNDLPLPNSHLNTSTPSTDNQAIKKKIKKNSSRKKNQ